jgi:predicted ATPase
MVYFYCFISEGYLIPNSDEYMRTAILSQSANSLNQLVFPEFSSSPHLVYRFAHDRVQQAAAVLVTQEKRKIVHGRIAVVRY